ncbi:hypothetical protein H4R99_005615 [Coemansia sp. RSA 1722]|nr:hypothetical protein LPJ57_002643 [Coemansia sp. RSA 486]KAJ2231477.1 hypothetical protein IWW45_005456 [Coemansia sp. RSA 485]KAJ2594798.1 hypothetical protein H4R99_005615 [Coemansia sp. RSA 1722]
MATLEALPQEVFNQIALDLETSDLATLALTSRRLQTLSSCDQLWLEKISADFGNRHTILDILNDADIDIAEMALQTTELVPWTLPDSTEQMTDMDDEEEEDQPMFTYTGGGLRCYRARYTLVFPETESILENNTRRADNLIDETKHLLRAGPDAGPEVFAEAAMRLMIVQDMFPSSVECYYLWALICYMLNKFPPALRFLEIGQQVDADHLPSKELLAEVQMVVDGAYGKKGETPLLNKEGTGPSAQLAKILAVVFQRLDTDRDGVLNAAEIGKMVRITNGQAPNAEMVAQIIHAFGGQVISKNGRRVMGWDLNALTNFYVAQTLDDPKETRSDLAKFGFDPQTLK